MHSHDSNRARPQLAPAGLVYLAITTLGGGFSWPITKYLLSVLPPLSLRGWTGVAGALLVALIAVLRGENQRVPRRMWPRVIAGSVFNVGGWIMLLGLALLWLPAGETALIAYTMPAWASLLAWPILGERPSISRLIALAMAFAGLAAIFGGNGFDASMAKLPGFLLALAGAIAFAVGTVLFKKNPLALPPFSAAAWQIGLGCLPAAVIGFFVETTDISRLTPFHWALMGYGAVVQFAISYVTWFAALARLPASVAAMGTLVVPVIGVIVSAITLHEPLGLGQLAALAFTLAGVALATRPEKRAKEVKR